MSLATAELPADADALRAFALACQAELKAAELSVQRKRRTGTTTELSWQEQLASAWADLFCLSSLATVQSNTLPMIWGAFYKCWRRSRLTRCFWYAAISRASGRPGSKRR
jgi:hypothetical protein